MREIRHRRGFDLRAQELPYDLVRSAIRLTGIEDTLVRIGEKIARSGIDEKEFFFDPESDREVFAIRFADHELFMKYGQCRTPNIAAASCALAPMRSRRYLPWRGEGL